MTVGTEPPAGLTSAAASELLAVHGPNRLDQPAPRRLWRRVAAQLGDPMILVLLVAGVLTLATGDAPDTAIIALVIVMNTATGVVQERRAEQAIAELSNLTSPSALVIRDGTSARVQAEEIVPGDLVVLSAGDVVPADGALETAVQLSIDESTMTGESLPVRRAPGDQLTAGTLMVRGRGTLTVTQTGGDSGLGRLAALVRAAPVRATPLQQRMSQLSRTLVAVVLSLTFLVVTVGLLSGRSMTEMLVVGASLAVAAVPESLPAVLTVALAMGAHRMAKSSAAVRRLPAVETLGSVTVIATDKTGTLTEGRMVADEVWTPSQAMAERDPSGQQPDLARLLRDVVLCNDAEQRRAPDGSVRTEGDPLEVALLDLATRNGIDASTVRGEWDRVSEEPFDASTRQMTTQHRTADGRQLLVVKGAPEVVFASLSDVDTETARDVVEEWAARGYRVLAVAESQTGSRDPGPEPKRGAGDLTLVGLVAVLDPPRAASADVVAACQRAGLRVILVTGDHATTALSIAERVGIATGSDQCLTGEDLRAGDLDDQLDGCSVFARVLPEQKVDIVRALQARGEVVAMLGDGVNDAPSLRHADIGVAAGLGGTEVARQAADLVLLDDDLGTVVSAVQEGRRIFANIRSFLVYAISGGMAEVGVMLLGSFIGMPLPLLPGQILWINLLTHGLTGVAFSGEPADPADMDRAPVPLAEHILATRHLALLGLATAALTAASLSVGSVVSPHSSHTAIFLTLGLGQLGVALALRARRGRRRLAEQGLLLAVGTAAALMLAASYLPLLMTLLNTHPLPGDALGLALAGAVVPGLLVAGCARLSSLNHIQRRRSA